MKTPEFVILGSHAPALFIHTNRIPIAGETVIGWNFEEPRDGGKGSNQAVAAARLGATVAYIGMVGNDRLGNELFQWFREENIDGRWLHRHDRLPTGVGFNITNKEGDCALVTCMGANEGMTTGFIDAALADLAGGQVFLTQFEIPPDIALYAARKASASGMTSIVNPAPAVSGNLSFEGVNILIPNEIEAKVLTGLALESQINPEELLSEVANKTGVRTVIITLGEGGIIASHSGEIWHENPPKVSVVDAAGAGDQFCAALGVGLIREMSMKAACSYAMKAAALSVTRRGTIDAFVYKNEILE